MEGEPLLEQGLLCVLTRHLPEAQAERTIGVLRSSYPDWNELRVAQVQEFRELIPAKDLQAKTRVAAAVRDYLQEIFQKNHGFDLEFLRQDPLESGKFVLSLDYLGASAGHFLLWRAANGGVPLTSGVVRVLDRIGLVKRPASLKKALPTFEALVAPERRMEFGLKIGKVIEDWCDAKKPICWECALVEPCHHGKKVLREWRAQQKRLEVQRKREEERRAKEAEKERRRAEAEAKKRAAEEVRAKKKR